MRTSIRGRLVFSYVLMTVLSVAVMGGLGLSLVSELGQLREQRQLGLSALAIADQAEPWLEGQAAPVVLGELAQGAAFLLDARVRILGSEATVLADAMAVDQGAQIAWLAAAPADPAADPAADPSEPRPGEAPAEPTFARRLEDVHELIFASGALTQAEQGRPAGGLTFALRRGEPSFGPGGMQLELLTQAAPPGQVVTRGLELARVVHALDASDRVPELEPVRIELGPMALRVDAAGGHHALLDDGIGRHLATFLAGDLGQPEPPRSPRVVRVAIGPNEAPTGFVEISQAPDVTGANLGATARAFGLAALGASLLSALVGLAMSRGLSAPLAELDAVAARMGAGDLAARAPLGRPDEIGRLARRFNGMADGLEASFAAIEAERDALRRFVADASHELRTPITALANYNALLQGGAADDDALRGDFLAEQERQIERLAWITRNLLDLSRLDAGLVELERETCSAASLFEAALAALGPKAEARRRDLQRLPEGLDLRLDCDPGRVAIALANLIDNAIKFSPEGRPIRLRAAALDWDDAGTVRPGLLLEVEDGGPGIHAGDAERIFERFHRGPGTAAIAGSGLGLAIVRGIAQAHGGWVRAEAGADGGARLCLWLPGEA